MKRQSSEMVSGLGVIAAAGRLLARQERGVAQARLAWHPAYRVEEFEFVRYERFAAAGCEALRDDALLREFDQVRPESCNLSPPRSVAADCLRQRRRTGACSQWTFGARRPPPHPQRCTAAAVSRQDCSAGPWRSEPTRSAIARSACPAPFPAMSWPTMTWGAWPGVTLSPRRSRSPRTGSRRTGSVRSCRAPTSTSSCASRPRRARSYATRATPTARRRPRQATGLGSRSSGRPCGRSPRAVWTPTSAAPRPAR